MVRFIHDATRPRPLMKRCSADAGEKRMHIMRSHGRSIHQYDCAAELDPPALRQYIRRCEISGNIKPGGE